jgi:hypothetical protein
MKNLPEDEWLNQLSNRLSNYTEEPDETLWSNIEKEINPSKDHRGLLWMDRVAAMSSVAFLILLIVSYSYNFTGDSVETKLGFDRPPLITQQKNSKQIQEECPAITQNFYTHNTKRLSLVPLHQKFSQAHSGGIQEMLNSNVIENTDSYEFPLSNHLSKEVDHDQILSMSDALDNLKSQNTNSESISETADSLDTSGTISPSAEAQIKTRREASTRSAKRRPSFYVMLNPTLAYNSITPLRKDDIVVDKFDVLPVMSVKRFGWSSEIGLQGRLLPRLEYYSSIVVYTQSQQLSYHFRTRDHVDVVQGENMQFAVNPSSVRQSFNYTMINAGIQSGLLYELKSGKLSHKVGVGLSYQHGFRSASGEDTYDNSQSQYLSYRLSYRNEYHISKLVSVFIQPAYSNVIWSREKLREPFRLKPSYASLGFGLIYHF